MIRAPGRLGRWLGALALTAAALAAAVVGDRIDPWLPNSLPPRQPAPATLVLPIPPLPPPVERLSAIPAASWPVLARALAADRGAPSAAVLDAWQAATDCRGFERRAPAATEAARAQMSQLWAAAPARRIRLAMALPVNGGDHLELPDFAAVDLPPIVLSLSPTCRAALAAAALPGRFLIKVSEAAPWPRSIAGPAAVPAGGAVTADLVAELAPTAAVDAETVSVRPVALYLWADDQRRTPVAALGRAAPGSQDQPIEPAAPIPPAPARPPPLGPGQAPPVTAQPRRAIEVAPLPAPVAPPRPTPAIGTVVTVVDTPLLSGPSGAGTAVASAAVGQRLSVARRVVGIGGDAWLELALPDGRHAFVPERATRPGS